MIKRFLIIVLIASLLVPVAASAHHGGFFGFHFFDFVIKTPYTFLKKAGEAVVRGSYKIKNQMAAAVFVVQENINIIVPSNIAGNEFVVINSTPNEFITSSETLNEPTAPEQSPITEGAAPESPPAPAEPISSPVKKAAVKPIAEKSSTTSVSAPAELSSAPVELVPAPAAPSAAPAEEPPAPAEEPTPAPPAPPPPAPLFDPPTPKPNSIQTWAPPPPTALPGPPVIELNNGQDFSTTEANQPLYGAKEDTATVYVNGLEEGVFSNSVHIWSKEVTLQPGENVFNFKSRNILGESPAVTMKITLTPVVSSVSPASLPRGVSNQNIEVYGKNFADGAAVTFSGSKITVNSTTYNSLTHLTANISIESDAPTGSRNVKVTNPDNRQDSCNGCFTVIPSPTIYSVTPFCGTFERTYTLAISGANFASGASVALSGSGITVNSTVFNSSSSLTANITISAGASTGGRDVTVANPNGGTGTAAGAFTVAGEWGCPVLAGAYNTPSSAKTTDVFVVGTIAYLVTDGSGDDLYIIDVANIASPVILGSLELGAGANAIYVSGNYAYIASQKDSEELQVVDISNPASPSKAGTYDKQGSADARGVVYANSKAYLVTESVSGTPGYELYAIDVSAPSSPTLLGGLNIGANVYGVALSGNYAYLATADNDKELQIIDVSNPSAPSEAGVLDLSGSEDAYSVFASGNYVHVGRKKAGGGNGEFYVIDVSSPSSPMLSGQFEVNEDVNGVFVSGAKAFLATNASSAEFQVIDVSAPSSPSLIGSYNLTDDANSVFVSGNAAFVATDSGSQELAILGN